MHFVVDVLALRVEALQDLRQNVDGLLAAQTGALGLELLQQVFGGHRFTDEVAPHCFLRQLHVAAEEKKKHKELHRLISVQFFSVSRISHVIT